MFCRIKTTNITSSSYVYVINDRIPECGSTRCEDDMGLNIAQRKKSKDGSQIFSELRRGFLGRLLECCTNAQPQFKHLVPGRG